MNYFDYNTVTTGDRKYKETFWNKMKGYNFDEESLRSGRDSFGMFLLPDDSMKKYKELKDKEDIFKDAMTRVTAHNDSRLFLRVADHMAEWIKEGGMIQEVDGEEECAVYGIGSHKLATIIKFSDDFVHAPSFDIEKNVLGSMAKAMCLSEEKAFITGDGVKKPYGLLHEELGAEVGVTSDKLTFDDVIAHYLSVKPKYRKKGKWLMNDETALVLRTLKDSDGNYLWNQATDTILGKEVIISEFMPSDGTPILFGDLEYYWIIDRREIYIREMVEMYAEKHQIGYMGVEYLDGVLTKRDAVKVFKLTTGI